MGRRIADKRLLQDAVGEAVVVLVLRSLAAGRGHVDRRAIVAVGGAGLVVARRHDADHLRVVTGEAQHRPVIVAGRYDDDHVVGRGVVDGVVDHADAARRPGAVATGAERHIDDLRPVVGGPDDALGDVGVGAAAVGQHLDGHDAGVIGQADDARGAVGAAGHRAGDVGAVIIVVERRAGIGRMADGVVLGIQRMAEAVLAVGVDAGIEHGHDHAIAGGHVPGLFCLHLRHVPLARVERVVGCRAERGRGVGGHQIVRLDAQHGRVAGLGRQQGVDGLGRGRIEPVPAAEDRIDAGGQPGRRRIGRQLDQHVGRKPRRGQAPHPFARRARARSIKRGRRRPPAE